MSKFIFVFLLMFPFHAVAHAPYFQSYGDWITYEGETYRLEGWYGDGIFFANPVRVVLKHKNGGFSAISPLGETASGFCPSIKYCWGFTFSLAGFLPHVWRLNPDEIIRVPEPVVGKERRNYRYPEDKGAKINTLGFDTSYNIAFWPIAWLRQATLNTKTFVIGFISCALVLACHHGMKISILKEHTRSTRALRRLIKIILGFVSFILRFCMVFFSAFHALGPTFLLWFAILFTVIRGINSLYKKRDCRLTEV